MSENVSPGGASRQVHLVLSAGGMKCIAYAGAIETLVENGVSFASVSASSGGSLIGALVCAGITTRALKEAVYKFDLSNFAGPRVVPPSWVPLVRRAFINPFRWPFAKYESSRIDELFFDIIRRDGRKPADYDPTFAELSAESGIPFATCGVDMRTHRIHVYSGEATPDMKVSEALKIATAVPIVFPPHKDGDQLLLDGALVSQSPVWLATVYGDDLPILVLRPDKSSDSPYPRSLGEYLSGLIDLGGGSRDYYLINQIPRARLIEVDPGPVRFDQFDLPSDMKDMLIANGRAAVETNWNNIEALLRGAHPARPSAGAKGRGGKDASEKGGDRAMESLIGEIPVRRDQVFISYSHEDREWLHRFQDTLAPYIWNKAINLWDDTKIPSGALWYKEIKKALASAKVAVLLVTIDYLASDFIKNEELQEFVRASEEDGLKILWVAVGHSGWKQTPLFHYQAVNDPELPLNHLQSRAEQDRELVRICDEIAKALDS
ncbi:MAG: patatin-like phospholipase family protein [Pyrinomonadaceae bacterium]